ncbi:MAG: dTMP kinase [Planctomycetota bacterium]|nr:dTMP kinase [Planctomycetota bacterium]MDA1105352.1 dTMP kinase [Planctomycetota bacterium]
MPPQDQWIPLLAGKFIVFDGPDGSGKSTQFRRFSAMVRAAGVAVEEVREPGGTAIGEQVRTVLLDPANASMTVRCEMLLYMASRAQLVEERIRPALARGSLVLADRFISSTLAYQGTAGGLDPSEIRQTGITATSGCTPDLVVVFDVDEATAAHRLSPLLDRMEQKGAEFHARVRHGFLAQVRERPAWHLLIDASRDPDIVWDTLLEGMAWKLQSLSARTRAGEAVPSAPSPARPVPAAP